MKIFIRTYDKENETITEKESANLESAKVEKKINEKIHLCFHDENPVKPCKLIE
jgi:hypothetical protein